jgi:Tfp pilus assembly protein PilN
MIEINLLPGAKRKRAARGAGFQMPDLKALAGLVKDPWLIAFISTWLLFGLMVVLLWVPRKSRVNELGPRLTAAQASARRMNQVLAQRRMFEMRRESLLAQIAVIRDIDRERYVWPHIMEAVTRALPAYTWLDEMAVRAGGGGEADSGGPGTAFQLSGKSADIQAITRFVRNLEDSPFIQNVATVSTGSVTEEGRDVYTYVVTAQYSHPDSTLLTMQPLSTTLVQGVRSGGGRRR